MSDDAHDLMIQVREQQMHNMELCKGSLSQNCHLLFEQVPWVQENSQVVHQVCLELKMINNQILRSFPATAILLYQNSSEAFYSSSRLLKPPGTAILCIG